jgi:hypothetical protein
MKRGAREMVALTTSMHYSLEDLKAGTGVVTMSSEEMRTELEIFVNRGLREGWRGWPRHDSRGSRRTISTDKTNRTCKTVQSPACSDRSHKSYPSYMSN